MKKLSLRALSNAGVVLSVQLDNSLVPEVFRSRPVEWKNSEITTITTTRGFLFNSISILMMVKLTTLYSGKGKTAQLNDSDVEILLPLNAMGILKFELVLKNSLKILKEEAN